MGSRTTARAKAGPVVFFIIVVVVAEGARVAALLSLGRRVALPLGRAMRLLVLVAGGPVRARHKQAVLVLVGHKLSHVIAVLCGGEGRGERGQGQWTVE